MGERATKRSFAIALVAFAAGFVLSIAGANRADGQLIKDLPENVRKVGVDQKLGEMLPLETEFSDERGRKVRLKDFFDGRRPVLLTLNYSDCPMLCSMQLNKLVETLDTMDLDITDDFQIVTVSIDPKETPLKIQDTKQKYVSVLPRVGVAEGWHFLIGKQDSITTLADSIGFRYEFVPETGQYSHAAMLAFCTPEGQISSYLLLIDYPPEQVKLGLIDASSGAIGTLVDNFLLYCSVYNPKEGSYTYSAWVIMRLSGGLTVLLLLVTLVPYWVRKKKVLADLPSDAGEPPGKLDSRRVAGAS